MSNQTASGASDGTTEPVLTRVALYKHGVGAFLWRATVGADGMLVLPIPAHQIDDVLKSLLVVATDGTQISSIAYTTDEPLQRRLRNFGIDLQDVQGISDFLNRMIGATVKLRWGSETLQGQIISTEVVEHEVDHRAVRTEWLLLLTDGGTIERVDLGAVRGLEVVKGEPTHRLQAQLDLIRTARQPEVSRLMITATAGQVLDLTYVAEAPVWKMTYRIVLGAEAQAKPFLQGWAIAENTSAADWQGVSLSLLSGMPLSFTLDLSHPRFRARPAASIPEVEMLAPPVAESALPPPAGMAYGGSAPTMYLDEAAEAAPQMARMASPKRAFRTETLAAAPPPPTTTRSVGDLFEYHLDHPVTIPAQQAALIPVLAGTVDGGMVSVYNASVQLVHPLNAVRLRNSTGLTLDAGPITVMREDTYVGEALIDVIKPGEERFVSYAVDLGCRVDAQSQSTSGVAINARIRQGIFSYDVREVATTMYRLSSITDEPRTVVIEHPIRSGWDVPTPAPATTSASYYRYEVSVPPRSTTELAVRDAHTIVQQYSLRNSSVDQIGWLIMQIGQPIELTPMLQQVAAQFRQISDRQTVVNRLNEEIRLLGEDQSRLRSNLQALGQGREERDLARRYVEELTRSEDRIGQARNELNAATQALYTAQTDLGTLIDRLDGEWQIQNAGGN